MGKPINTEPKLREADYGPEKLCTACNEWWPADLEFFSADPGGAGGLFYCCKACYKAKWGDAREARRLAKKQLA